jgi:hypothetical protein
MSARGQLNSYLLELEKRLKRQAWLRGIAVLTLAALVVTVVLVLVANHYAFSDGSLWSARAVLFLVIGLGIAFGLAIPLWRLTRRNVAGTAEAANPGFDQRLITFTEREAQGNDPFIELLAEDTLRHARNTEPGSLVPNVRLMASLGVGLGSLAVLVWMVLWGPGYLGYGSALLWMGGRGNVAPMYDLRITPGDATVRKNSDELVTAVPIGLQAQKVSIFARYANATKWSELNMQPQQGGSGYQFLFAGLPDGVEYYVVAGPLTSRHYNLKVVDVAGVKQIRVTYRYPSWTGMPASTDEHAGDMHAIQGTQADLEVVTDRPLANGELIVDDKPVRLSGGQNNTYHGTIGIEKDGTYHVGTVDDGQPVRLSEDYFIEADKPNAPEIALNRPGHDYQASPIEEVTLSAKAGDDFGLTDFALHYSINGGAEKSINLLKQKGTKSADGSTTLSLEDFKVAPGDVVSVYATANDARTQSRTDIYFIQAEPFEREFSQSQAAGGGGGGGGGGNQGNEISQREKEIIGSTWKQLGDKESSAQKAAENAKFLSDVQSKLRDQAVSLAGRLQSRDIPSTNAEFGSFEQDMTTAAQAMGPASEKLQKQQWKDALPNEEKALQALLRAEATIRRIEVAFQRGGGGGGGGGGNAGRDLASLFDLELDTAKNQYETAQTAQGGGQGDRAQQIDDALKKLDELAKRQEELAQQRNASQQPQQRWEQEMLRREAEQLQQQLQQLAQQQNSQNGQDGSQQSGQQQGGQQSGSQSGSQSASQSGSQGGGGSQQNTDAARAKQALDQLRQANEDMRNADQQPGGADARRAADRLRQAQNALNGMQRDQSAGALDSLANEADRLAGQEQAQSGRLQQLEQEARKLQGGNGSQDDYAKAEGELQKLLNDRQKQADDLSHLESGLRNAERQSASSDRATAGKLRNALSQLDENDLGTRIQRSADRLRTGYVPTDDASEQQILQGMQQLAQQVREAQQGATTAQNQGQQSPLDRVQDLRNRLEALDQNFGANRLNRQSQDGQQGQRGNGQPGQNGQQGQNGQPQMGQLNRNGQPGQQGQGGQQGQAGQQGQNGQGGNGQQANNGQPGQGGNGAYGNNRGNVGPYGGDNRGGVNPWIDTGGNTDPNRASHTDRGPLAQDNIADAQAAIDQGMNQLNQLRQDVATDPETKAQVDALIKELQSLDPRRFPGNPAMVDELHNRVLNDVDRLEMQLRSKSDEANQSGQVRSADPMPVPAGYQDDVAEYFRKLSKNQ